MDSFAVTSEREWEGRVLDYAGFAADQALEPDFLSACTERLWHDWHVPIGTINYDEEGRLVELTTRGMPAETLEDYEPHYQSLNPYPGVVARENLADRTVALNRYVDRSEFRRSEYYNDFMQVFDTEYALGMSFAFSSGARTSFTLYRGEHEGGDFDSAEVRRLDMLRPIIRQALLLRSVSKSLSNGAGDIASAATSIEEPAVLILEDGRVRALNDAGERYLAGRRTSGRALVEQLRSGSNARLFPSEAVPGRERLPRGSSLSFVAKDKRRRLQEVFDLSPREPDVAAELLNGLSNREVAGRLGITVETCRSYVKTIHRKSGISTTKRFIRAVADLL